VVPAASSIEDDEVDEIDNDLVDDLTQLDPNLEPPLPAVTTPVESAPIPPIPEEAPSPVVSRPDITREQSNYNELDPPPALEYEPTVEPGPRIEPASFNQASYDAVAKPIIPQRPVPNVQAPKDVLPNNVRPNNVRPTEKEAAQSKPVATDAIHWTELSYDLGLQGFAQAIAINSVVGHYEKDHLQLFLTPDFMKFVNPENQDEICQALASKLGLSLILDLHTLDRLEAETPSETRIRKEQEHRQAAIESIKQEQTVKKLQRAFGAELVEVSVQLVDEQ
jgi:hypothetical protein